MNEITISGIDFPEISILKDGELVELKIMGTVKTTNGSKKVIEIQNIEIVSSGNNNENEKNSEINPEEIASALEGGNEQTTGK